MKNYFFYMMMFIAFLLFSCSKAKQGDLLEIPVDIDQNISLHLSEITEELTAIELELTDKSLINPDMIRRFLITPNNVILTEASKVLIFDMEGKFIRSIGSIGQGPGEFINIMNIAVDEKNNRLFIFSSQPGKFIWYEMSGKFIKEYNLRSIFKNYYIPCDFCYMNDELLMVGDNVSKNDEGRLMSSEIYLVNDDFHVLDSLIIRKNFFEGGMSLTITFNNIFKLNTTVYLYYHEIYNQGNRPSDKILRDTLYRFEKTRLIPELKLKFKNDGISGGNKFIDLYSIYRSSRYIFSNYEHNSNKNKYYFCYDTKTGKGYNMQDGYTDDINGIDIHVKIRPFNLDTEMLYYLHTNMKPDDFVEPNPTLYIGKLKK